MGKLNTYVQSFNTGVQDKTALPRVDLERMRLAAEIQTNLMCRATGPGFMRPGLEYLVPTNGNAETRLKEFIFGVSDAALFEFSTNALRIILNDAVVARTAVSSAVVHGDFSSSVGWNTTGVSGGAATITGAGLILNAVYVQAIAQCAQAVATASPGVEHALRINVSRGPVFFRCGSSAGADDFIAETQLGTGVHSLAFTPSGTFNLLFFSKQIIDRTVSSVQIEAAGAMVIPTTWDSGDLGNLRLAQSADVCFVACNGQRQRRIERRGSRSWSVVDYVADDGPFQVNASPSVRLKPNALNGIVSLTASSSYFNPGHVGMLFRLDHQGQVIQQSLSSEDTYTDPIRVTGVSTSDYNDRDWAYTISGTWSGILRVQRSYDGEDSGFKNFRREDGSAVIDITANGSFTDVDGDDNSIIWYRIGFQPGTYTSGAASVTINYDGGGGFGICRVIGFVSSTIVQVEVLKSFKNIAFTLDWRAGEWGDSAIWPSAVALADGRLWQSGSDRIWGSVSDAFASYDEETEGDSGPISRSIATGGVNNTQWLLSLQRLLIGTEGTVSTAKSSSLDEPLSPTNFGIKDSSTTGAAPIDPIKVDTRGLFVERAGAAMMELAFDSGASDYAASQISKLTTDLFTSGVKAVAVQRRPDTRIWIVMNDGTAACMVYEPDDKVLAFIPIETDGAFESVAVLPSLVQDRVYFSVRRVINGSTVRYIEKMALDSEVKPATQCKVMDAFNNGTNSPASATLAVGTHLIGESVVAWADGAPIETSYGVPTQFVVNGSGNITLPAPVTDWVAGLPYRTRFKSARLAYGAQGGTAMLQKKTVDGLGLIMTDFVRSGVRYGHSFDDPYRGLFPLPQMADGKTQPNVVLSDIRDEETFAFPGEWNTDSRICLELSSPYTATFLGLVFEITTNG